MSFDLTHIWASMGIFSRLLSGFLLFMGLTTLTLWIERTLVYARTVSRSRAFAREVGPLLEAGDFGKVLAASEVASNSHLAFVFRATLRAALASRPDGNLSPSERGRREQERALETVGAELRRGHAWIASVGSISPFVGLLGTVAGIISAFQSIAATGSGGLSSVAGGISESLVETALGLVVAIPAVLIFNQLSTRCDSIEAGLQQAAGRLIDNLEDRHHGDVARQQAA